MANINNKLLMWWRSVGRARDKTDIWNSVERHCVHHIGEVPNLCKSWQTHLRNDSSEKNDQPIETTRQDRPLVHSEIKRETTAKSPLIV